jgi:hypothetical protein
MVLGLLYRSRRKPSLSSPPPPQPASSQSPTTPPLPPPTPPTQPTPKPRATQSPVEKDPAERLEDLKKLLDHNLITEEDYEKKRKEILSQI